MRMLFKFDVTIEQDISDGEEEGITEEELFEHLYKLKKQERYKGIRITCLDKEEKK